MTVSSAIVKRDFNIETKLSPGNTTKLKRFQSNFFETLETNSRKRTKRNISLRKR